MIVALYLCLLVSSFVSLSFGCGVVTVVGMVSLAFFFGDVTISLPSNKGDFLRRCEPPMGLSMMKPLVSRVSDDPEISWSCKVVRMSRVVWFREPATR